MKKTIAITSALAAASSLATAEIKINEFLSFAGFVDASYSHTDLEQDGDKGTGNSFQVDEVEIDWMFNFGSVTAQIDLQHEGGSGDNTVEQAFVSYDRGNGISVTAGRFESSLGLEAKEPTGLYQFSKAYDVGADDNDDADLGLGSLNILPQYNQGVKLTKVSGDNVYSIAILDEFTGDDSDGLGGDNGGANSNYGVEASASIALGNGMTWFLGGAYEDGDQDETDAYVLNTHLTVQSDALTYGVEVSYGEDEGGFASGLGRTAGTVDEEVLQALIMANYAYSDCCSVTGRISYSDHEEVTAAPADTEADFLKYTLAHNYAVTDNLALITEVSYVDGEIDGGDYEALVGAVEVLFSF
jgi:hypothetical protein